MSTPRQKLRIKTRQQGYQAKLMARGLCTCCGKNPIRQSKSGKSRLCEVCHAEQVERMRQRGNYAPRKIKSCTSD